MALDDPTVACNGTNEPWGSQELCYTGPLRLSQPIGTGSVPNELVPGRHTELRASAPPPARGKAPTLKTPQRT
jgi:hypothetical protein